MEKDRYSVDAYSRSPVSLFFSRQRCVGLVLALRSHLTQCCRKHWLALVGRRPGVDGFTLSRACKNTRFGRTTRIDWGQVQRRSREISNFLYRAYPRSDILCRPCSLSCVPPAHYEVHPHTAIVGFFFRSHHPAILLARIPIQVRQVSS